MRRDDHAGKPRQQPCDRVDGHQIAPDANARLARCLHVAADCIRTFTDPRVAQHDVEDERGQQKDRHRLGAAADRGALSCWR